MSNYKKYSFLMVYIIIFLPCTGFYLGGIYNFITFIILFSLIPLIDYFIQDKSNPDNIQSKELLKDKYYVLITLLYIPVQMILLGYSVYLVHNSSLSILEWIGFASSTGLVMGGVGINLAHELMHKNSKLQQIASKFLLSMVCYGHFFIEHVRGHHINVATPHDPATARLGESLYQFLPRTIIGSLQSAWAIERKRLERKHLNIAGFHNQFWWIIGVPVLIIVSLFLYGGLSTVGFFLLQSLTAILTLEIVNYIEHYGLLRRKLENGRYEKVSPLHSWNASHWLSNIILIHLQRHSDHHTNGGKPYQILLHIEESPQLPSGYLGMIILALFPPLWRAVMDPRVRAHQEKIVNPHH